MSIQLRLAARAVNENQTSGDEDFRWSYSCMGYREMKQRGTSRFPSYQRGWTVKPTKQHSDCQGLIGKEQLRDNIPVPRRPGGEIQYT